MDVDGGGVQPERPPDYAGGNDGNDDATKDLWDRVRTTVAAKRNRRSVQQRRTVRDSKDDLIDAVSVPGPLRTKAHIDVIATYLAKVRSPPRQLLRWGTYVLTSCSCLVDRRSARSWLRDLASRTAMR
jgi:hypothetical protein